MSNKFSPEGYGIYCCGDGTWSLFRDIENFEWWCGDECEWVSPYSGYWQFMSDCWNEKFKTANEALNKLKELVP